MSDFLPSLTASAQFAGDSSGPLVFTALPSAGMSAALAAFFKGDKGEKGDRGVAGTGATTTYVQSLPSAVWTCPHNLQQYPSVTVVDPLGQVIIPDVFYIDNNIVRVTHGSAISGTVYFN